MTDRTRQLLIGDFARRCRLPVSTLRYYDRIGLLVPAVVDPATGYRRYTVAQLPSAVLVSRLRAIGTAPRDIARVLAGGAESLAALAEERRRIEGQVHERQRALGRLDDLLSRSSAPPSGGVRLVELTAARVAAVPLRAPSDDLASAVLRGVATLRSALRRAGSERTAPWGAAFPVEITEQVRGFVFARTAERVRRPGLDTAWLPVGQAAQIVHHGSPDTVAAAYCAAFDVIDENGWNATGPVIEEYPGLDAAPGSGAGIRVTVPVSG